MTTKSIFLACSVAAVLLGVAPVRAENLIEVYQDAVRSDPLVREAEARRSAALEVKPQARALLLPQINVGGQLDTADADGESTFPQVSRPPATSSRSATGVRPTSASIGTTPPN